MTMLRRTLAYNTTTKSEVVTITPELNDLITQSGVQNGTLLAYSLHTTFGLLLQETSEPNLCEDFLDFLTTLVENNGAKYRHACALHPSGTCEEDRYNAPSHVRQLLTNQSIVLDIQDGRLQLGQWQDVAFCELDGPRVCRNIQVKILPD